jgi:hypothetical protein
VPVGSLIGLVIRGKFVTADVSVGQDVGRGKKLGTTLGVPLRISDGLIVSDDASSNGVEFSAAVGDSVGICDGACDLPPLLFPLDLAALLLLLFPTDFPPFPP